MIALLRDWLVGITSAAMIVALADSLAPAGTVRKIGRMVGGLVLLVAVLQPILEVDFSVLAASTLQLELDSEQMEMEKENQELLKTIIGEKTGAYILDKAAELGIACQEVTVTCAVGEEEVPYPAAVVVTATLREDQQRALSRIIEGDLAIPEEHQTYQSGGETP